MSNSRVFRSQYERIRVRSSSGNRMHPQYQYHIDNHGVESLKKTGQVDVYKQIQSWKDSCDVKVILEKYLSGDQTALYKKQTVYGDFSSMPTSLADFQNMLVNATSAFYDLPLDVRAEFNHSPSQFFTSIGTEKFNKAMGRSSVPSDPLPAAPVDPVETQHTTGQEVNTNV